MVVTRILTEHCWNRHGRKHLLQSPSVQVDHGNYGRADHAYGNKQVLAWAPERIRVQQGDVAVSDGEENTVLHEHRRHVAVGLKVHK